MKHNLIAFAASLRIVQTLAGPLAPRDDWPVCAWIGWDTHESFWNSTDGTYPACSAACFSQPNCKGFSYTKGDCNLYDIDTQTNINWDLNSPYLFWDRNCEIKFQSCSTLAYQAKFDSFFWSNTLSQDQCTDACTSNSNCKSLAFGNGECYLYDVPTKGNMDGPGSYLFSDVGCFKSSTTSSTASTTTSTKQTTTSTTFTTTMTMSTKPTQASTTTTTAPKSSTTSAKTTTTTKTSTAKTTTKTTKTTTKAQTTTTRASTTTSQGAITTTKKNVAMSTS